MPVSEPPKKTQVLVIGGGPAGSYAATTLAREGFDVVLFEMAKFPRYHVGESLIPSARHFLRFIDAEDKIAQYGFTEKPGSAIKFNQYMREGYTDFVALGAQNNAWNVTRSEFDQILLQHAASSGVRVFEQTRVTSLTFTELPVKDGSPGSTDAFTDSEDPFMAPLGRPVAALYETTHGGKGEIAFNFLVDASGKSGLMSTRYLKNRKYNDSLKNIAMWGYWSNTGKYGVGTPRENAPWFEALSDGSGWAWYIPLHNGHTSIGVVMNQRQAGIRSRASSLAGSSPSSAASSRRPSLATMPSSSLADRYLSFLHLAPGVVDLIGEGDLVKMCEEGVDEERTPLTRSTSDFSYCADAYAGEGWRIIGDAGAFIDPFFSSGVHIAFTSALTAATSISASTRGDCSEAEAARWHTGRVAISYTRFLVIVLSAYKQMHAQSIDVLGDINEDDFDKAFSYLRPLVQGAAEMGARLSEDEVQRALDFCVHLFDPTTPEQHEMARRKLCLLDNDTLGEHSGDHLALLDIHTPLLEPAHLEAVSRQLSPNHSNMDQVSEMKMVLNKVNARRVIYSEHAEVFNSLEEEAVEGYVVRLRRGSLGLDKAPL